jgi:hypothetical protein
MREMFPFLQDELQSVILFILLTALYGCAQAVEPKPELTAVIQKGSAEALSVQQEWPTPEAKKANAEFIALYQEATKPADVPLGPENWPTTLSATVNDIIALLSDEGKETLRKTKREDLIEFHFGWGMEIRNYYGLWRGNNKLLESACGKPCHPDDATMVIIEKVWEALQK